MKEQNNNIISQFFVAIRCMTFQHANYIKDTLDGFCRQKTLFPFVALVVDDASTDGEQDVINRYMDEHFDLAGLSILPDLYVSENRQTDYEAMGKRNMQLALHAAPWRCDAEEGVYTFAQHKTNKNCYFLSLNLKKNLYGVKGSKVKLIAPWDNAKYIAMCEGDDYWTDPYKLQKQVDFLEGHEEYILCFHKCKNFIQRTGEFTQEFVKDMPGESTITDLAKENYIHTPSVVYRRDDRVVADQKRLPHNLAVGDYVLWMLLAQYGKIMKLPDEMAVYRIGVGVWSPQPLSYTAPRWCRVLLELVKYFDIAIPQVSEILEQQMCDTIELSIKDLEYTCLRLKGVGNSHAYRLGKFILRPFSWVKRKIKGIK